MILARILLKLGGIGLYRIGSIINFIELSYFLLSYFLFCFILRGILCLFQTDIKKIIAYSSIFHIRIIPICLIFFNLLSCKIILFRIIFHGIISPLLFLNVRIIYEKEKTRQILLIRGISIKSPLLIFFFIFTFLRRLPTPPFMSFIQEI